MPGRCTRREPRAHRLAGRLGGAVALALVLALASQARADGPGQARWVLRPAPTADDLHELFFLDDARGWLVTHATGRVFATEDGGATWRLAADLGPGYLESIRFVSAEAGWLCGNRGRILRTGDGGRSWEPVLPPAEDRTFYGLHLFDRERGLATGIDVGTGKALLLLTRDGGRTWKAPAGELPGRGYSEAVRFLDQRRGFVGGFRYLLETTDGGESWTARDLGPAALLRGLAFGGARLGWAVGRGGAMLRSADAGATWESRPPFTDALLRSVLFLDAEHGYVAGDRDGAGHCLWRTSDGGESWFAVGPGEEALAGVSSLHRLARTTSRLWAVGGAGTILTLDLAPARP